MGEGRYIEGVRDIKENSALRKLIGFGKMPSSSTFCGWLRWMAVVKFKVFNLFNSRIIRQRLRRDGRGGYILWVDYAFTKRRKAVQPNLIGNFGIKE